MYFKVIVINTRNWVDSSLDRDYWRALVNLSLNLEFRKPRSLLIEGSIPGLTSYSVTTTAYVLDKKFQFPDNFMVHSPISFKSHLCLI